MISATTPAPRGRSWPWLLAFTLVIGGFFFEHLFLGRSLLPLDMLNQMLLPRNSDAPIQVQTHYPIDELTQLVPNAQWWRESVEARELPLWNRHLLGGNPQQASGTWSVWSPFKLGLLFLSTERWWTLSHILQFWMGGVFLFGLLRQLGRSAPAAFLGACAWSLCSNFLMFHWLFLNTFVWMPLALWCWEAAMKAARAGREPAAAAPRHPATAVAWGFGSAVALALAFVGGNIQFTVFSGFLWGVWALGSFHWQDALDRRRGIRWIGVVGLAAVLLSAPQWGPKMEFLRLETQRLGRLDSGAFGVKHAILGPVAMVATFLFPALAGSPQTFDGLKAIKGNLIDFNGAIGVVPWALFAVGVLRWRERRARNLWLLIAMAIVLVFFTPAQRFLYHRFLLLAVFAAVIVATAGFDSLDAAPERRRVIARIFTLLGLVAVLTGVGLFGAQCYIAGHHAPLVDRLRQQVLEGARTNQFGVYPEWLLARVPGFLAHFRPGNPAFALPIGCLLVAAVCARRWAAGKLSTKTFTTVLLGLTVLDLSVTLRDRVPRVDPALFPFYPRLAVLEPILADRDVFRVHRWMPHDRLVLMDNLGWAYGLETLTGYDSMSPDGLSRWPLGETNGFNRLLDAANVKFVLSDTSVELPRDRFELVAEEKQVRAYRNRDWLPRIWFVPELTVVNGHDAAMAAVAAPTFDPRGQAVCDVPDVSAIVPAIPSAKARVEITHHSSNRTAARVETSAPGVTVYSETWYPGWEATVDGRPARVLRINGVMQGVLVGAGPHEVEFRFRPIAFRRGLLLAGVAVGGGLLIFVVSWRSRPPVSVER